MLYSHADQEIHGLNAPASFVWRALERRVAPEPLAAAFAARFGTSWAVALASVSALLRDWRGRGWLAPAPPRAELPRRFAASRRYRLLGTTFRVRYGRRAQEALVHPALAHLEVGGDAPVDVALDLLADGAETRILEQGRPTQLCHSLEELTPRIKLCFWRLALNRRRYFMEIHAAALVRGGRAVLLPAAPGGGKSTLAAGLVAAGFRYLSDESALLEEPPLEEPGLRLRPVPLAITVKPGSVPLLEPLFPGLAALPAHRREDGRSVRYLAPPHRARLTDPERTHPVSTLVFPRVAERTQLRVLPRSEALRRLLSQCVVLPERLDPERVRRLVGWLRGLRCFELATGPLPRAVAAVRRAHGG